MREPILPSAPGHGPGAAPGACPGGPCLWGHGKRLRVALAGGGAVAARFLAGLLECSGAQLVGVTEADLARELEPEEALAVAPLGELLTRADAVVLAVPVDERSRLARRALECGRHVLVPAPLAATAEEALALIELARERARVLCVGDSPRHDDGVQTLRAMVRKGRLGGLQTFESVRATTGPADVLWELAPRDLAAVLWIRGMPATVACEAAANRSCGSPTSARVTLRYAGGFVARLLAKQRQLVELQRTTLTARRGTVAWNGAVLSVHGGALGPADVPAPFRAHGDSNGGAEAASRPPLAGELADFVECVESGAEPLSDGPGGLDVVRLLELAHASLERGGVAVPVP